MSSEMADAIRELMADKGYTENQVFQIIEGMLKAAYKRKFGQNANAIVKFNDDHTDVSLYSRKVVVDGVYDPTIEIELEEAKELAPDAEEGDELDILIDPKSFERSVVQTGKQTAHQSLSEIQKDSMYAAYKDKLGHVVIGYYVRERNGAIYIKLGKDDEGVLPVKYQSPRETYIKNDKIKTLITELKKTSSGLQIILSRTDPNFVRELLEVEVPEISDGTIEIYKVVREAGYRTKIAVYSHKNDVDPVGACVGLKGVRIQSVIRELEGEKIDVLKFDPDPRVFIKNALSPAEVIDVIILDEDKKQALAIVNDSQFSLAIGKQGLNVRLANKLVDWNIDVKTEEQCEDLDLSSISESRRAVKELFNDDESYDAITTVAELPGIDENVAELLKENNIVEIEDFIAAYDDGSIKNIEGLSEEDIEKVNKILEENVEFVDEEPESETDSERPQQEEDVYECPVCGAQVTPDMTTCPKCGCEISFEYEDEE